MAAACAALGLLAARPAAAAESCAFSVTPVPVKMVGPRPTVMVKVNGRDARFLLDSGSAANVVSDKLAADLLKVKSVPLMGAAGKGISAPRVFLDSVEFPGVTLRNQMFLTSSALDGVDGVIGQPMLRRMDVDYDLRAGLIGLVKTEHCQATDMVYWAKPGQAYSKLPLARLGFLEDHDTGDAFVNGRKMRAIFDTGAAVSFITRKAAARAGVRIGEPGVRAVGKARGFDGEFDTWIADFAEVKIGDEEIKDAPLRIGQAAAFDYDVLIGADFFLSHHVYVSRAQHVIYFAYDGGPVFQGGRLRPPAVQPPDANFPLPPADPAR